MSQIDKLLKKFNRVPIPNDITLQDIEKLAKYYGCEIKQGGGKHPHGVIHRASGKIIPIPVHGKHIQEVYVKQLKELFNSIEGDM